MQTINSEGELVFLEIDFSKSVDMTDMFKDAHSILGFPIFYRMD